jgi:hypothetical protein
MESIYKKHLTIYNRETEIDKNTFWQQVSQELSKLTSSQGQSDIQNIIDTKYIPYPSTDDLNFNHKIYRKKEFQKNKYAKLENQYDDIAHNKCNTNSFLLTENQRFLKNFISPNTPYNSILLYHSVGTGKTCTAISIAEQFSKVFNKKHLVLVSPNIKDNFRKQIFDVSKLVISQDREFKSAQCTGTKYVNLIQDIYTLTQDAIEKKAKKLVNNRYEFKGYMELSNDYDRDYNKVFGKETIKKEKKNQLFDMVLNEKYSNRVIIIDEVHNLRSLNTDNEKVLPAKLEHILRVAENVKLILLTATPMFNDVMEIIWLVNIMLLNDKKPMLSTNDVFDKEGRITKEGKIRLYDATRGRISYLKGENPYSFPIRLYPDNVYDTAILTIHEVPTIDIFGKPITNSAQKLISGMHLVKSNMSSYQKKVYDTVQSMFKQHQTQLEKEEQEVLSNNSISSSDDTTSTNSKSSTSRKQLRPDIQMALQISNIVFPHAQSIDEDEKSEIDDIREYYGYNKSTRGVVRGFNRCFKAHEKGNVTTFSYRDGVKEFLSYDSIARYSAKMKSIIDYILNAEGIVFVYSSFLYSGIIPLAMALEHVGFEKYDGNTLLTNTTKRQQINPTPKYIILSANTQFSTSNDKEIEVAKHPNNQDGSIIKVILGSSIATEGIDFKNIREIHILEPWYHLQKQEQIIGRGARHCSHKDLPISKRNVMIYQHVNMKHPHTKKETIDLRICRIAVNKQYKIDEVTHLLRSNAVDCALNIYANNHEKSLVKKTIDVITSQGKIIKDFFLGDKNNEMPKCVFQQKNNEITSINTSTFSSQHLEDHLPPYIDAVRNIYKDKVVMMSLDKLANELKKHTNVDIEILINALDLMIKEKIQIIKETPYQKGYLIYKGNKYIWQPSDKENEKISIEARLSSGTNDFVQKTLNFTKFIVRPDKIQYDIEDFFKKLESRIKDVKATIKPLRIPSSMDDKLHDVLVDYVVDRLNEKEFISLLSYFRSINITTANTIQQAIWRSIKRSGLLYEIDGAFIFRNIFDTKDKKKEPVFVMMSLAQLKSPKKSPSSIKLIPVSIEKEEAENQENKLKKQVKNEKKDLQGFLMYEKNTANFKTIPANKNNEKIKNKTAGSVCAQNPKLSVDILQAMILEKGGNLVDSKYKYKKDEVCQMFEVILRLYAPVQFARPYEYYLLKKK